jgi:hypothetical protein
VGDENEEEWSKIVEPEQETKEKSVVVSESDWEGGLIMSIEVSISLFTKNHQRRQNVDLFYVWLASLRPPDTSSS